MNNVCIEISTTCRNYLLFDIRHDVEALKVWANFTIPAVAYNVDRLVYAELIHE